MIIVFKRLVIRAIQFLMFAQFASSVSADMNTSDEQLNIERESVVNSVKHTSGFYISQPVEKLFPLFTAEGEKLWVPGWDYKNVMGTTQTHEDYIFLTSTHDHASTEAIWLVKTYEPEDYLVQYYKVEPQDKVGIITVQNIRKSENLTYVKVSYEYIGISDKENTFIKNFDDEKYKKFIGEWKSLLVKYFTSN
jgi:hypothetical protein